jgi:hypothetical protein
MQVASEGRLLGFHSVREEVAGFAHEAGQGSAGFMARRTFGGDEFFFGINETGHSLVGDELQDEGGVRRGSQTVNRSSAGRPSTIDSFDAATSIIN